ncbi:Kinesin, partial [Thalictrum thalictroides]
RLAAGISGIMGVVEAQTSTLQKLRDDHSGGAIEIEQQAQSTFQDRYTDYEPSGTTPTRSEEDVPTKGTTMSALINTFEQCLDW